jgi:signal transduction histidine kinase
MSAIAHTRLVPSSWLRLPNRTARLRLTLLYAGLFLLAGTVVIAITYLLAARGGTVTVAHPVPVARNHVFAPISPVDTSVVAQRSADLDRLLGVSWLALAVTTLASAPLGWFAAGRVLRPLRAITDTARTISAGNLHERLALAGPEDEFKRLGDTLDDLLSRLQAAFEAQRRFVANASHELRTPLTLERTLLQVALADPNASAQSLRSTCEELLVTSAEQERLLESLLTLTSSERGLEKREPIDLAELTRRALRAHGAELARLSLTVSQELAPAATSGDGALITRLVANLVDNALHHNLPGGRIDVRTVTESDHAILSVANSGREIPADQVSRLLEPFQRLQPGRSNAGDGRHGLGLSIVRAIALAHDATLTLRAQEEGGLAVTVAFPAQIA